MILPLLVLLVALATVFTMATFLVQDLPARVLCLMLSVIMWLSAAPASVVIQIPYQVENAADNVTGSAVTGVHELAGIEPGISWLFLGIGVLVLVYGWYVLTREGIGR